jgi:hypothetical protein
MRIVTSNTRTVHDAWPSLGASGSIDEWSHHRIDETAHAIFDNQMTAGAQVLG